jgi:aminoglycoside/choline kinase family phosphotransferase
LILLDILVSLEAVPKTIQPNIHTWVTHWLSKERLSTDFSVSLLLGDGSSRSFYRISTKQGSYILVSDPQWTQTQDYPAHQTYLEKLGLPVPTFYEADPSQGFLLMQDLGDELLQVRIKKSPDKKMFFLKKAITLLAELHGKTYPVPADLPVSQRAFDGDKYFSELKFTLEYLHLKLLNQAQFSNDQINELRHFCESISQITPRTFSHRDYHCRNLLVLNDELKMIDFQDARMGPPHYDIASLLYDAYCPLTEAERADLLKEYKNHISQYPIFKKISWHIFESDLKQIAFQRTVKAAGSFASFFIRFGKATHWPYLTPALTSALQLQKEGFGVKPSVIDLQKWITLVSQIKIQ